jgi:hypothetical protein
MEGGLAEHILSLPYPLFEQAVVLPILAFLTDLLSDVNKLFVLHWPKFSHLSPQTLPLGMGYRACLCLSGPFFSFLLFFPFVFPVEVICDGLLRALRKESVNSVPEEESFALFIASGRNSIF